MKNKLLNQRAMSVAFVVSAVLVAALTANASSKSQSLLLSAGFKTKFATTAQQRQELKTLPEGRVSPVTQNGKKFYVYPDASRNQLYVGKEPEYQAYRKLAAKARGSAEPILITFPDRGNPIKVREFYGFGPLEDMR